MSLETFQRRREQESVDGEGNSTGDEPSVADLGVEAPDERENWKREVSSVSELILDEKIECMGAY